MGHPSPLHLIVPLAVLGVAGAVLFGAIGAGLGGELGVLLGVALSDRSS